MSTSTCALCGGECNGADLTGLITRNLAWLWERVAALADRRGDPDMTTGAVIITAPPDPAGRAAARTLLGGRPLTAGQSRRIELPDLHQALTRYGPALTPGAVAAHACGRTLATRTAAARQRAEREATLRDQLHGGLRPHPGMLEDPDLWDRLRTSGWVTRLLGTDDPPTTLNQVLDVLGALPAGRVRTDRRHLAERVLDDPHGLDSGPLPALVLGVLIAQGRITPRTPTRAAWAAVGVDLDDLLGGLIITGLAPAGWTVPDGTVVTLPPRTLARCTWPEPSEGNRAYVTENPSILAAAADQLGGSGAPVICTSGTPSATEVAALARLAQTGWSLHVRADFDGRGLQHVRTLVENIPTATPWRMGTEDYLHSLDRSPNTPAVDATQLGTSPWDPTLVTTMAARGRAAFEETLLAELLGDLTTRDPARSSTAAPPPGGGID